MLIISLRPSLIHLSHCNIQSSPGDCIIMSIYVSRTGLQDYDVGFFCDLVSDKLVQTLLLLWRTE